MKVDDFFNWLRNGEVAPIKEQLAIQDDWVHRKDNRGYTPLVMAAYYNQTEIMDLLIKHGAKVDSRDA